MPNSPPKAAARCVLLSGVHRVPPLSQQRTLINLVTSANLTGDTRKFTVR